MEKPKCLSPGARCARLSQGVLFTEKVRVSERGCAPQKWHNQVYQDGGWHVEERIDGDVYTEGCQQEESQGLRGPRTEYCYCAYKLCNSAQTRVGSYALLCAAAAVFLTRS